MSSHRTRPPFGYPTAYVPLALGPRGHRPEPQQLRRRRRRSPPTRSRSSRRSPPTPGKRPATTSRRPTPSRPPTADRDGVRRQAARLCGSLPGRPRRTLASCGDQGGQIADLRAAAIKAAGLRIRHAAQASENNLHAIAVEEERFGKVIEIQLGLAAEIEAAHGQIFQIKDQYGEQSRSLLVQAEAMAECAASATTALAQADELQDEL
jgi:hypothetical protein